MNDVATTSESQASPAKKASAKSVQTTTKLVSKKADTKNSVATKPAKVKDATKVKVKKEKLIRDSFTIPESEYKVLADMKKTCLNAAVEVKKSELIRIALAELSKMSAAKLTVALNKLTKVQAGRPKK